MCRCKNRFFPRIFLHVNVKKQIIAQGGGGAWFKATDKDEDQCIYNRTAHTLFKLTLEDGPRLVINKLQPVVSQMCGSSPQSVN